MFSLKFYMLNVIFWFNPPKIKVLNTKKIYEKSHPLTNKENTFFFSRGKQIFPMIFKGWQKTEFPLREGEEIGNNSSSNPTAYIIKQKS